MGSVVLSLGVVAVATSAALVAACLSISSRVGFLLATYVLAAAEIVLVALGLSLVDSFDGVGLGSAIALLLLLCIGLWIRRGRPRPPAPPTIAEAGRVLRDRAVAVLAGLVGVVYGYLVVAALTVPQSLPDTLVYHLPRAVLWTQQRAVGYVAGSPDERLDATPPVAEIGAAASLLASGSDRFVPLLQLLAVAVACTAIFGIARRLGVERRAALFGALVFAAFPVVALQAPTALNDLVVAAFLLAAAYFALGATRAELVLAGLALALALGTKVSAALALPVLVLFVAFVAPAGRRRGLVLTGLAGVAAGSFWYVVNLVETGRLDGSLAAVFGQTPDRALAPTLERLGWLALDLAELSRGEGEGELLRVPFGAALAIVAAVLTCVAALALRRRRLDAAGVLVAGLAALAALPMVTVWIEAVSHGARRTAAALGHAEMAADPRVPEGLYEDPMHSAYGLGFVALLLGAGVLVVREVRRRTLRVGALVAIVAPVLLLAIVAVAITYDPMRMRLLAFAVGLAASLFGLALRVRPLAWSAVTLTAVSLMASVVYFAPRPAGLALFAEDPRRERAARWYVQGESGGATADSSAFRFFAIGLPRDATVAVAVARDTYLYPLWNGGLKRRVVFVPDGTSIPAEAEWLVVGPGRSVDPAPPEPWRRVLATPLGWTVLERRARTPAVPG